MGVNARKRRRGNDEEQEDSEELLTPRKRKKSPGAKSQSGTLNTPVRDDVSLRCSLGLLSIDWYL